MLIKKPINLLPKQTATWDLFESVESPINEIGYGGGAGGGKTELGCLLFIYLCDVFVGSRWVIGRYELKNLKRTTLASFFEVARKLGLKQKMKGSKEWDYDYNQQDGIIKFNNGDKSRDIPASEIIILDTAPSPRDPLYTNFGGLEISGYWIDESNETPAKAIEVLGTRVGRRNMRPEWVETLKKQFGVFDEKIGWILKPIILETFNPEKGHIYTRFWKPFKEGTLPPYRAFVRALYTDNPFLSRAYIQQILKSSKATIERLLYGNFDYDDDPSKIFEYEKILDLFSNTFVATGDAYLIGDIAGKGNDKTVLTLWNGLRVFKIYSEEKTDQKLLRLLIERYREKYKIPLSHVLLDYDGIGVGIVDELGCRGFQANASPFTSPKEKEQGLKANFANLRSQCWFELADKVNANEIYVETDDDEVKEHITEELDVIKEINDGKDKPRQVIPKGGNGKEEETKVTIKSLLGRSPDFGDSLMMRMWFEVNVVPEPTIRTL